MMMTPPENWLQIVRAALVEGFPPGAAHFEMLVRNPFFRRQFYEVSGLTLGVPLSVLDDIAVHLADEEAAKVPDIQARIQAHRSMPLMVDLEVADGATSATVQKLSRPVLVAHRNLATAKVGVRLYWPRFRYDMWNFTKVIRTGTFAEREAAFRGDH